MPVATPLAFVAPAGCVSVLPLPVADSTTVAPLIGLPLVSRAVAVIVELPLPAWIDVGDAVTLDRDAETTGGGGGGVAVTGTTALCGTPSPLIVRETAFDSAVRAPGRAD